MKQNKNLKKKMYNYKHIIVVLCLMLLGFVGLVGSNKITNEFISNLLSQLFIAIFISGTLGTIDALFTKASLVELIFEKLQLNQCIQDTGLETIYCDLSEIPYAKYFREAKNNITIHHIYGQTWTNNNIGIIEERLKKKGSLEVDVILLNPDSKFNEGLDDHFSYNPGLTKQKIEEVTKQWKELKEKIDTFDKSRNRGAQGRVKVHYYNGQPGNSVYLIDERIIVVLVKTLKGRSNQLPALILCDNNKNEGLFERYKQILVETLSNATNIF